MEMEQSLSTAGQGFSGVFLMLLAIQTTLQMSSRIPPFSSTLESASFPFGRPQDERPRQITWDPQMAKQLTPQPFTRLISFPSPKKVAIDMEEILSGHQVGGWRLTPGHTKSLFPADWNADTIESAVREAYKTADTMWKKTGDRLLVEGSSRGWRIRLWYNTRTKEIETAYPNRADVEGSKS